MVDPIEDSQEFAERLMETEVGDDLTVEIEGGPKVNREVTFATEKVSGEYEVFVGKPQRTHLDLFVDYDEDFGYTVDAYTLTEDPDNPLDNVGEVKRVWFWD